MPFFTAQASLRRGTACSASGKAGSAFRHFMRAARTGSPEGAYRLGRSYLEGVGVPADRRAASVWLEKAAERGHIDAQLLLAILHINGLVARSPSSSGTERSAILLFGREDYKSDQIEAARWAELAARAGSAEAQALLAVLLSEGPASIRDADGAKYWSALAAAGGSPKGMVAYAFALMREDNEAAHGPQVIALLNEAVATGLPSALLALGMLYDRGWGLQRNPTTAMMLYRRAAEAGDSRAQMLWGRALIEGRGVDADRETGETWLRRAALAGDSEAQTLLGDVYAKAVTTPPNYTEAAFWYRHAADGGHVGAARALGRLYLNGTGVPRDCREAVRLFRIAAKDGHVLAQADLANLFFDGTTTAEDRAATCHRFAHDAAQGDPIGAFNYGVCLAEGVGTERDEAQAAVWLEWASDAVVEARYWYGRFLLEGRGVPADPASGRTWISKAAEAGLAEARTFLDNLPPENVPTAMLNDNFKSVMAARAHFDPIMRAAAKDGNRPFAVVAGNAARAENASRSDVKVVPSGHCTCGSGLRPEICCALPPERHITTEAATAHSSVLMRPAIEAYKLGDFEIAAKACHRVLEAVPVCTKALWLLHKARLDGGDPDAAIAVLRRIVAIDPNHLSATLELATLMFERDDLDEAERHARNAVRLAPTSQSHNVLAMILTEAQQPHAGEHHYRQALDLTGKRDPILLANLAWNLKGQGRIEEARSLYEESAAAAPKVFQTWLGWSQLEESDGRLDAARERLARAGALRPDAPELRVPRSKLLIRERRYVEALTVLDQPLRPAPGAGPADPNVLIERGRLLDKLSRFEEAFAHFDESKRLVREMTGKSYLGDHAQNLANRLRAFFTRHRCPLMPSVATRHDVAQPIFILGFPRSGTTLVEQALSNHPKIIAGGELPFINEMADEVARVLGSPLDYPEALSELWMGDKRAGLSILRDTYLEKAALRGLATNAHPWFTDKMPLNETHLGLIASVFPHAPLIHLIRHPLDVILSVYSHQLTHGYFCGYGLETAARHYKLVMELVDHYTAELPLTILPIRYEALVEDFDSGMRRILGFVGEEFDKRCVNFQDNMRRPQTPSYQQVTEKIHDRSLFRYRRYLKELAPAIEILRPTIERLGYEVK